MTDHPDIAALRSKLMGLIQRIGPRKGDSCMIRLTLIEAGRLADAIDALAAITDRGQDQSDAARPTITSSGVREGSVPPASDPHEAAGMSEADIAALIARLRKLSKTRYANPDDFIEEANAMREAADALAALSPAAQVPRDQRMADAAEMLWIVLANVSGGDWTKQTQEWQDAAARWRDNYFAALAERGQDQSDAEPSEVAGPLGQTMVRHDAPERAKDAALASSASDPTNQSDAMPRSKSEDEARTTMPLEPACPGAKATPGSASDPTAPAPPEEQSDLVKEINAYLSLGRHPLLQRARSYIASLEAEVARLDDLVNHNARACVIFQAELARAKPVIEAAQVPDRDRDWILAIGHALGLDSGYKVPIVPKVGPFKELFAAIRERSLAESREGA